MPLILIDALPSGQVLINTDQIVKATQGQFGGLEITMTQGRQVHVPHESVDRLLAEIQAAQGRAIA
jgi:hypothetical protein